MASSVWRWLMVGLVGLVLVACQIQEQEAVIKMVDVASYRAECVGVAPQSCYLVRENPADDWRLFYDAIHGFDYEAGYDYTLRIRETRFAAPPADASAIRWQLIEVVSMNEVRSVLADSNWHLVSFGPRGAEVTALVGTDVTLHFDATGRASGSGGCNNYFASYAEANGLLSIGPVAATKKMCAGPVMPQETAYFAALSQAVSFIRQPGRLSVFYDEGRGVLHFVAREGMATPQLTWESLRNAAYPSELAPGGVAQLTDGEFRQRYTPDSATELVIQLAEMRSFGDVDGDGLADALVILIAAPGGTGVFLDLVAVLNEQGVPNPVASAPLGDRVIPQALRAEDGRIVLEMMTHGPDDPQCCPNVDSRLVYVLEGNVLTQVERTDTPRAGPPLNLTAPVEVERIEFAGEGAAITVQASVAANDLKRYVMTGSEGQMLTISVTSPNDNVLLSGYGTDNQQPLVSILDEATTWSGVLPATQDYAINVVSLSGEETLFTLQVEVLPSVQMLKEAVMAPLLAQVAVDGLRVRGGPGTQYPILTVIRRGDAYPVVGRNADHTWLQVCCFNGQPGWISAQFATATGELDTVPVPTLPPTPVPTPTPPPASPPVTDGDDVIYLTFDDGPTDPRWTPQVLAALAEYNAQATFFVLGIQAERYPQLIADIANAGHAVANHTWNHASLSGIEREAFFAQVQQTQEVLGEHGARCLRPPYGATDAYTRAYATELGYALVMWNVDTEDWRRPGAEVIAERAIRNARPGAIVLFHDGGGDRAQTVAALGMVLRELSAQGYRFEALCKA